MGGKSAHDGSLSAVGAERVCDHVVEPYPFAGGAGQIRGHAVAIDHRVGHGAAEALQKNQHYIRSAGGEYVRGMGRCGVSAAQRAEYTFALRVGEVAVVVGREFGARRRGEEREDGVGRGLIQKHIVAEVYLAYVGGRGARAAADGQKQQSA